MLVSLTIQSVNYQNRADQTMGLESTRIMNLITKTNTTTPSGATLNGTSEFDYFTADGKVIHYTASESVATITGYTQDTIANSTGTTSNTFKIDSDNATSHITLKNLVGVLQVLDKDGTGFATVDCANIQLADDTTAAYSLIITSDSTSALSADRTLTIDVNNGSRMLDLAENFTIGDGYDVTITAEDAASSIVLDEQSLEIEGEGTATRLMKLKNDTNAAVTLTMGGDQDISTDGVPQFAAVSGGTTTKALFIPIAATQSLSGAGAIDITSPTTLLTTTGADALTLVNSTIVGQMKKIIMVVDGGAGTLTPTSLVGGTTLTFADAGDVAELVWNGTGWVPTALYNVLDITKKPTLA
jgi:hypothetical protein